MVIGRNVTLAELALLSKLAYRRENESEFEWSDDLGRRIARLGWTLVEPFDRIDTQGFIARRAASTVVVFRGTEPDRGSDLKMDANCRPRRDRVGVVHSGFSIALDHVWDQVYFQLSRTTGQVVYFTGHSAGGAIAQIAATRIVKDMRVGGVVTFGAPPALSRFLADLLEAMLETDCVRVERADAVTMVSRFLYRSAGVRTYITQAGRVIDRCGSHVVAWDRFVIAVETTIARARSIVRGRFREACTSPFLTNHSIDSYCKAVNGARKRAYASPG
jgi:hypothetical protein